MAMLTSVVYPNSLYRYLPRFSHNELISVATFGLKKQTIQQGDKNFFVSKSFETYGGLTPLTYGISIPSFVVLRCPAATLRCLKVLKIQQREIF